MDFSHLANCGAQLAEYAQSKKDIGVAEAQALGRRGKKAIQASWDQAFASVRGERPAPRSAIERSWERAMTGVLAETEVASNAKPTNRPLGRVARIQASWAVAMAPFAAPDKLDPNNSDSST